MNQVRNRAVADGKDVIIVDYPTTLWPAGSIGFNRDIEMGKQATVEAVKDYQSRCGHDPDAEGNKGKIEIVGYSQGARVAGDALSDIGNNRVEGVSHEGVTGTLYSDPRQEGISAYPGRGIELSFAGVIPGLSMNGPREDGFGEVEVKSICSQGDGICYLADPVKDPLGAVDSLLGYFLKHGDYPLLGWMSQDSSTWSVDNPPPGAVCEEAANNGGLVCVVKKKSSVGMLVEQAANALGIPNADQIPDIYGEVQKVLNANWLLPGVGISTVQPVINLIYDALPQLPYVTYNAGGYLPDAFTFVDLITGIIPALSGNPTQLVNGATSLARSVASILVVPLNATIYWGNQASQLLNGSTVFQGSFVTAVQNLGQIPGDSVSNPPFVVYPANGSLPDPSVLSETQAGQKAALAASLAKAESSPIGQLAASAQADTAKPGAADRRAARLARWKDAKPGFTPSNPTTRTPTTPDTTASHQGTKPARLPGLRPNTKPAPDPAAQADRQPAVKPGPQSTPRPQFTRPFSAPRPEQTQPQNTQPPQPQYTQPQQAQPQPQPADTKPPPAPAQQTPTQQRPSWTPSWKSGNGGSNGGSSSQRGGFGSGAGQGFTGGGARFGSGATQ